MKKALTVFLVLMALWAPVSHAADNQDQIDERGEPSGTAMLFDVLITRPLGIAAAGVGAVVFVVGLPFTIPTHTVGLSARKLVGEPLSFTFRRPVGEIADSEFYRD